MRASRSEYFWSRLRTLSRETELKTLYWPVLTTVYIGTKCSNHRCSRDNNECCILLKCWLIPIIKGLRSTSAYLTSSGPFSWIVLNVYMLNILCLVIGGTRFRVRAVSRPGITVVNNRLNRRVRLFASFQVFLAHGVQKADKVLQASKVGRRRVAAR